MANKNSTNLPNLESSIAEINQLIDKMEHSELTLEQTLTTFERGISLIKHCQKILSEAEQKVQLLMKNNDEEVLVEYGEDDKKQEQEANAG